MLVGRKRFMGLLICIVMIVNMFALQCITVSAEEKMIEFLRKHGCEKQIEIYSLKGISQGCADLLKLLNVSYTEHGLDEIFKKTLALTLPELNGDLNLTKAKGLKKAVFSKHFMKFSIKYGVIMLFLSFFTPYKAYYIIFGASLTLWGIFLAIKDRLNLQNQIPNPQS